MLSTSLFSGVRAIRGATVTYRNIGVLAPALQKVSDPIQQLFLDKIKEYKSKSVGGKLVDPTPEIERELKSEMDRLARIFGGGKGVDMTQFPTLKFEEAKVDPIDQQAEASK